MRKTKQPTIRYSTASRRAQAKFERLLIGGLVAFIVLGGFALVLLIPRQNRASAPPTPTPEATAPSPILVKLLNQHGSLHVIGAYAFDASAGSLSIWARCANANQSVTMELAPRNLQQPPIWTRTLACPESKQDTVTIDAGSFALGVNVAGDGDANWSLTILQE